MSEDLRELRERTTRLSDEELVDMVTRGAADYRQEALDYAKAELRSRGVDYSKAEEEEPESPASFEVVPTGAKLGPDEGKCAFCGGELRAGILVSEKELTVIFTDNREERFVKVTACARCGQLSLIADFDTTVGS